MPSTSPRRPTTAVRNGFTVVIVAGLAWAALRATAVDETVPVGGPPVPVRLADEYAPSRMPDRVILTITETPARSMAVTWRTSREVGQGIAQIVPAGPGPDFAADPTEIQATKEDLKTDLGHARYHSVTFEKLSPKTKYAYRVGDGANWSEWFHFTTASDSPEPFSFIYFGDAQNDVKSLWSRVVREAWSDAPKARFLLHAGDLIDRANADAEWGEWFSAGGWVNGMIPNVLVAGNHEYAKRLDDNRALSGHWRPQFTLPLNGPGEFPETVYSFDYQGVRVIVLDSNVARTPQVAFLDSKLRDNPCRWTIVSLHAPVFSTAKNRDNAPIREAYKPLFDKYRVDLVLQGHDHTYGRTGLAVPPGVAAEFPAGTTVENLAEGVTGVSPAGGTVYVVSVSGPKMYRLDEKPFMKRSAENTQLYQIIHIDGDQLRYEARTAVGDLYDAFALKKRAGQPNILVEQVPGLPERRWNPPK